MRVAVLFCVALCVLLIAAPAFALDAEVKAKIDAKMSAIKELAADAAVVAAAKEYNANPSEEAKAMTQEKWKGLSVLDPFVRGLSRNAAATVLKEKKFEAISEAFVSGADGKKVAFLSKTSSWSHAGKPKHDQPMDNEIWYGEVEVDESTAVQQVQVAVPVLDGEKPIGSLVVGLSIARL